MQAYDQKLRLFLAAPLSSIWQEQLGDVAKRYRRYSVRWLPPENWHLTLVFFGYVPAKDVSSLKKLLAQAIAQYLACTLTFRRFTTIQRFNQGMLWAEFEKIEWYTTIVLAVRKAVSTPPLSLEVDTRPPFPHITIARWKGKGLPQHLSIPDVHERSLPIKQLDLWRSFPSPKGSHYEQIESYALGKNP